MSGISHEEAEAYIKHQKNDDAFTPTAIDQAARDQERYDAGWSAGYDAAEAKRMPILDAYAMVIREVEALARDTSDTTAMDAVVLLREMAAGMEGE